MKGTGAQAAVKSKSAGRKASSATVAQPPGCGVASQKACSAPAQPKSADSLVPAVQACAETHAAVARSAYGLANQQLWTELADYIAEAESPSKEVNTTDQMSGKTALHAALSCADAPASVLECLLSAGADLSIKDGAGISSADLLVQLPSAQQVSVLQLLSPEQAQSHVSNGASMLEVAQAANDTAVMAALVRRGADVSKLGTKLASSALERKDDVLLSVLIPAVKSTVLDMLDLHYRHLVADGLPSSAAAFLARTVDDPGKALGDEGTYLHKCAAEGGSAELCAALLALGIPPNAQDAQGNTALHIAAKAGNLPVAEALCARGADVTARNKHNRTAKMVVSAEMKDFLYDAEEAVKAGKLEQHAALWDDKMKATQTQSALGIRAL